MCVAKKIDTIVMFKMFKVYILYPSDFNMGSGSFRYVQKGDINNETRNRKKK